MHEEIEKDLYEILGVSRSATKSEIKAAYRRKARECHPDVAKDDPASEQKFKELTFAYEILSDDQKRREYDMWGLEGIKRGSGIQHTGFTSFSDIIDMFFGEAFGAPFGRTRTTTRVRLRGRDLEVPVSISLREVLAGTEKEIEFERLATCEECDGSGMMPGTHMTRCEECGGTGEITTRRDSFFGTFLTSRTCLKCGGNGQVMTQPCPSCAGEGRVLRQEKIKVKLPPGVEDGDHLRISGKGEDGKNGGEPGDLYVKVGVIPEEGIQRVGKDLYTSVRVDIVDAALGCRVNVSSVDSSIELKIPEGTQPGEIKRIRGRGLPPRGGGKRGDLFVKVDVDVPRRLSPRQRRLLEQFRELSRERARES